MKLLLHLILGLTLVNAFVPFALAEEDNSLPDADALKSISHKDKDNVIASEEKQTTANDDKGHNADKDSVQPEDHDDGKENDLTLKDENKPAKVTESSAHLTEDVEANNPDEEKSSPSYRRSYYRRRYYRRRYSSKDVEDNNPDEEKSSPSYRRSYYRRRYYRRRYSSKDVEDNNPDEEKSSPSYRRSYYRRRYYRRRSS